MWTPEDRALVGDYGAGQALTDDQWRLLQPLVPPAKPGGRPRRTDMRRMLDSLFYVLRTGCQWRRLPPPPAFLPWPTVYSYFRAFLDAGVWEWVAHALASLFSEYSVPKPGSLSSACGWAGRRAPCSRNRRCGPPAWQAAQ
jgi:putative transposase